jgi:hypothetical protein
MTCTAALRLLLQKSIQLYKGKLLRYCSEFGQAKGRIDPPPSSTKNIAEAGI